MDWQTTSEDTVPSAPVTEADVRLLRARPPATGAWRDGDPAGHRRFTFLGDFRTENGEPLPNARPIRLAAVLAHLALAFELFDRHAQTDNPA